MISFLGPIKNDWKKVPPLLDSIRRLIKIGKYEILLIDDGSNRENQTLIDQIQVAYPELKLIRNPSSLGVIPSVNQLSHLAKGDILIPIDADIRFRTRFYFVYITIIFRIFKRVNFCFAKTRLIDQETGRVQGVVGWASKKGMQNYCNTAELIAQGKIRAAGGGCSYRKQWFLKSGGYDPFLGPTADFYINHLAILQGSAWYYGKIVTDNLVRAKSYTSSVSAADYRRLMERVITKWEQNGVILASEEKKKLIEYEKNESPSNLAQLEALGKTKDKVQESGIDN
jgi:glycosyltransferase involved in cell wall biosynthesis